jgi:hypothetical protein
VLQNGQAMKTRILVALLTTAWALGVVAGSFAVWRHAATPSAAAAVAENWPAASTLPRRAGRATLVLFAHPQCACTQASLRELERLLPKIGDKLDVVIPFVQPPGASARWLHAANWRTASAIPGVVVIADSEGREAALFGATTSGQVCYYDAAGRLAFAGGLTAQRGHEGTSPAHLALAALVAGRAAPRCSPVFGCQLHSGNRSLGDAQP